MGKMIAVSKSGEVIIMRTSIHNQVWDRKNKRKKKKKKTRISMCLLQFCKLTFKTLWNQIQARSDPNLIIRS